MLFVIKCVERHYFFGRRGERGLLDWWSKGKSHARGWYPPLIVHRFDDRWISAARGDVSYELDRQGGNLTYASSTTKDGVTTIMTGSRPMYTRGGPRAVREDPPKTIAAQERMGRAQQSPSRQTPLSAW